MFSSKKVILVTCAGYGLGTNICEELFSLKGGFMIRGGDRSQERLDALKKKFSKRATDGTFEAVQLDLGRPETIEPALKNVTRMVVYLPEHKNREQYARNLIEQIRRLSEPLEQLVLISVIGSQDRSVEMQKQFGNIEQQLRESNVPWTVLQTAPYQETITHFYADQISKGELRMPVKEDNKFGLVSIRELANACPRVMENFREHLSQVYCFTGPELLSGKDVTRIISETIGKEVKFHPENTDKAVDHLVKSAGWSPEEARPIVEFWAWMGSKGGDKPSPDARKLGVRSVQFKELVQMDREFLQQGKNRTEPL